MQLTYAPDADSLAIWFAPGGTTIGAGEIAPDTYADFDAHARLLGIEVLNAGAYYNQVALEQLPGPREPV